MRKLASIATIATAEPIPEADRLDLITLEGKAWSIVTGRNEFKPGDRAVYFEIDSALPADDERFAFLHDRCLRTWSDKHGNALRQAVRIRTARLKGVISQGLVMPISVFPELADRSVGDDVTSEFAICELNEIVKKATGREFAVAAGAADQAAHRIFVGRSAEVTRRLGAKLLDSLGVEESLVCEKDGDLFLVGGDAAGTLWAVYDFVEDNLGYRWYQECRDDRRAEREIVDKTDTVVWRGNATLRKPFSAHRSSVFR